MSVGIKWWRNDRHDPDSSTEVEIVLDEFAVDSLKNGGTVKHTTVEPISGSFSFKNIINYRFRMVPYKDREKVESKAIVGKVQRIMSEPARTIR